MTTKRKIADCLDVRVSLGNFNWIQFTKYGEEEIEFSSDKERIQKEEALRDNLIDRLLRDMGETTKRIGVGVKEVKQVEETITKKIPEWLEKSPVPNIANKALTHEIQVEEKQADEKQKVEARVESIDKELEEDGKSVKSKTKEIEKTEKTEKTEDAGTVDLFEDDEPASSPTEEDSKPEDSNTKKEKKPCQAEAKEIEKSDTDNLFDDDDDLFGDDF